MYINVFVFYFTFYILFSAATLIEGLMIYSRSCHVITSQGNEPLFEALGQRLVSLAHEAEHEELQKAQLANTSWEIGLLSP